MNPRLLRAVRLASLVGFAVACGLAYHRLHRTSDQIALTRYVEIELPNLRLSETPIEERLGRLERAPGLKPDEARTLLVDDVIPRLVRLRKQAELLTHDTDETRVLHAEYLGILDRLIDACRTCVHIIDEPKLSQTAGLLRVRQRFAEVRRALTDWNEHVQQACVRHRLAKPAAR